LEISPQRLDVVLLDADMLIFTYSFDIRVGREKACNFCPVGYDWAPTNLTASSTSNPAFGIFVAS
jgi:hypothetical protein